jgi:hypothetical protein
VIARARINSTVEGAAKEAKGPSRGQDWPLGVRSFY